MTLSPAKAWLLRVAPVLSRLNGTDFASIWITGLRGGDADRINASHRYQRQRLRHYVLWIVYTGMRPGEVHKLRHRHIVDWRTEHTGTNTLRIKVPHNTKTGAGSVIAPPAALGVYQSLQQLTQLSGTQNYLRYAQKFRKKWRKISRPTRLPEAIPGIVIKDGIKQVPTAA